MSDKRRQFAQALINLSSLSDEWESLQHYYPPEQLVQNMLTVFVGTGHGVVFDYLMKLNLMHGYYVFIDDKDMISHVLSYFHGELPSNVSVISEVKGLDDLLKNEITIEYLRSGQVRMLPMPLYLEESVPNAQLAQVQTHIQSLISLVAQSPESLYIAQSLLSCPFLGMPIDALSHRFLGKTAIVLGGAPSLDNCLSWVKKERHRLVVFAINRIASRLKEEEIVPDFFVAADFQEETLYYSKDMFSHFEGSALIVSSETYHAIVAQWPGMSFYVGHPMPILHDAHKNVFQTEGPTVVNLAFSCAVLMGFSSVVLAGVDFCFSLTGQTHESRSLEAQKGRLANSKLVLSCYDGFERSTEHLLAEARLMLEFQVAKALMESPSLHVVQLSEQAAHVEGVEFVSMEDVSLTESLNANVVLNGIWNKQIVHDERLQRYQLLLSFFDKLQGRLGDIKRLQMDANRFSRLSVKDQQSLVRGINRLLDRIHTTFGVDLVTIFAVEHSDYNRLTNDWNQELTPIEVAHLAPELLIVIKKTLDSFSARLDKTLNDFVMLRNENHSIFDFSLFESWYARKLLGRAAIWLAEHKEYMVDSGVMPLFSAADADFDALLQAGYLKLQNRR